MLLWKYCSIYLTFHTKEYKNILTSNKAKINCKLCMPLGAIYSLLFHGEREIEGGTRNTILGQSKKREKLWQRHHITSYIYTEKGHDTLPRKHDPNDTWWCVPVCECVLTQQDFSGFCSSSSGTALCLVFRIPTSIRSSFKKYTSLLNSWI